MRSQTSTLEAAAKSGSALPYVTAEVRQRIAGVRRFYFTRDFEGSQGDGFNALTATGDDHILRLWVNPADNKLYSQKI